MKTSQRSFLKKKKIQWFSVFYSIGLVCPCFLVNKLNFKPLQSHCLLWIASFMAGVCSLTEYLYDLAVHGHSMNTTFKSCWIILSTNHISILWLYIWSYVDWMSHIGWILGSFFCGIFISFQQFSKELTHCCCIKVGVHLQGSIKKNIKTRDKQSWAFSFPWNFSK